MIYIFFTSLTPIFFTSENNRKLLCSWKGRNPRWKSEASKGDRQREGERRKKSGGSQRAAFGSVQQRTEEKELPCGSRIRRSERGKKTERQRQWAGMAREGRLDQKGKSDRQKQQALSSLSVKSFQTYILFLF
ncbi:hypothetical protein EV1_019085 [Malus domestica]